MPPHSDGEKAAGPHAASGAWPVVDQQPLRGIYAGFPDPSTDPFGRRAALTGLTPHASLLFFRSQTGRDAMAGP